MDRAIVESAIRQVAVLPDSALNCWSESKSSKGRHSSSADVPTLRAGVFYLPVTEASRPRQWLFRAFEAVSFCEPRAVRPRAGHQCGRALVCGHDRGGRNLPLCEFLIGRKLCLTTCPRPYGLRLTSARQKITTSAALLRAQSSVTVMTPRAEHFGHSAREVWLVGAIVRTEATMPLRIGQGCP